MSKILVFTATLMISTVFFITHVFGLDGNGEKKVNSIKGMLLMLDDKTPHVAVSVQAIHNGKVIDGVLSDEEGKYSFINLKTGLYQVRCYIPGEYVYYSKSKDKQITEALNATSLSVENGKILKNIDFRIAPFKKGTWRNYDTLDGLPHNLVIGICRAPDGVMWFATYGGISRYDGKEFINFTTKDGLAGNKVNAIYRDSDGVIWCATEGSGLSLYDGKQFKNFTTSDGLVNNYVRAIFGAPDGVTWLGTLRGVSRYDGEKFTNFTTDDGAVGYAINSIARDLNGVMWFASWGHGVSRYDGKEFIDITAKDGLVDNYITLVHCSPNGVMWFGSIEGGVSRYNGKGFINFTTKDGLANNRVHSFIYSAPDGAMWFATGGGVSRYDGKGFINFTVNDGLANNYVLPIYHDSEGVMWFATRGGVSRYDEKTFLNFTTKNGLAGNSVNTIYRASDGVMWFATDGGVSRYDGKKFVNLTEKDGLASNNVSDIYRGADGVLWFTTDDGVSRYDGKEFVNLTEKDGLASNYVRGISCGPDGALWFGTWRGASRYDFDTPSATQSKDGKKFVNLTEENGLPEDYLESIHCLPDGTVWLGTYGGGVSRYDGKQFIHFTTKDGLPDNSINAIYRDADDVIWFGTSGGVSQYNGKEFVNLTTADGLSNDSISAIYRDSDGIMWFATGSGVSGYDGVAWTSLDTRDGLIANDVSSIHQDAEGFLWFGANVWSGTNGGITRYRKSGNAYLSARIISVRTDREYTDIQSIPAITTNRRITITYKSTDFKTIPEKQQYRYRVKARTRAKRRELDSNWRLPTKETSFDDSFDKPGVYTFEVQAIDRDFNYSEPASVTLKIVPPWYLNGWIAFPSGGAIFTLLTLSLFFGWRYYAQRQSIRAYERAAAQELRDANQVQMSLMPETAPKIDGIKIAGKCLPANTVSGDFFDYLEGKQKNEIALIVADVCGKGMKGAMNAVMADGVLHASAAEMESLSPAPLMMKLNNVLKGRLEWGMNITMVIGMIDADAKTLTIANAAHHAHPLLLRNGEVDILKSGGMPLGMMAGIEYSEEQFQLQRGDVVILMTDGIIEAQNTESTMYSASGRLENTISQFTPEMLSDAMVDAVISDAVDFGGDKTNRDDDMTVVVAKVL